MFFSLFFKIFILLCSFFYFVWFVQMKVKCCFSPFLEVNGVFKGVFQRCCFSNFAVSRCVLVDSVCFFVVS